MITKKKKIIRWIQWIIIVYCLIGTAMYYLQEKILFHPLKLGSNYTFGFSQPFEALMVPLNTTDTMSLVKFFLQIL